MQLNTLKPKLLRSVYSPNRSSDFPNNITQERAVDNIEKWDDSQI